MYACAKQHQLESGIYTVQSPTKIDCAENYCKEYVLLLTADVSSSLILFPCIFGGCSRIAFLCVKHRASR